MSAGDFTATLEWLQSQDCPPDMVDLTDEGRVMLVKNYGRKLIDPIPLESPGHPSRFLTYEWLTTQRRLGLLGA